MYLKHENQANRKSLTIKATRHQSSFNVLFFYKDDCNVSYFILMYEPLSIHGKDVNIWTITLALSNITLLFISGRKVTIHLMGNQTGQSL
jgi:hypothetical protein